MSFIKQIDRYEILDELGSGTYGTVYKASDPVLQEEVAIKELKDQFTVNNEVTSKFRREAQLLAELRHPNLVQVLDYLIIENRHYIVMEFCANGDLQTLLETRGRLHVSMAAKFAQEIFLGLQTAHDNGMFHRDLKPRNVLQNHDNIYKVSDFGLSDDTFPDDRRTYLAGGTKGYTAPEQDPDLPAVSGILNPFLEPIDHRVDIFAAGTLLWHMLTNRWPTGIQQISNPRFPSSIPLSCLLPDPRLINPDIPNSWVDAIAKCRQVLPSDRIQSMAELMDSLGFANNSPITTRHPLGLGSMATLDSQIPTDAKESVSTFGVPIDAEPERNSTNATESESRSDEPTSGILFSIAGRGLRGRTGDEGPSRSAALNAPSDVLLHSSGDLYIVDSGNHRIRAINFNSSTINTIIGKYGAGFSGDGSRSDEAKLNRPSSIHLHPDGSLYIADSNNQRIRRVDSQTTTISTVIGIGDINQWTDSTPAANSGIGKPIAIAIAPSGTVLFCDTANATRNTILGYQNPDEPLLVVAGLRDQSGYNGDGILAVEALLNGPSDVTVDSLGNIYIADSQNYRIRKVDKDSGYISTIAGTGTPGTTGDGGPASIASVGLVTRISIDSTGNLWMLDNGVNSESGTRVRKIDFLSNIISTEVGGGSVRATSEDVLAETANVSAHGFTVDSKGDIFLADATNHRVWKATLPDN